LKQGIVRVLINLEKIQGKWDTKCCASASMGPMEHHEISNTMGLKHRFITLNKGGQTEIITPNRRQSAF